MAQIVTQAVVSYVCEKEDDQACQVAKQHGVVLGPGDTITVTHTVTIDDSYTADRHRRSRRNAEIAEYLTTILAKTPSTPVALAMSFAIERGEVTTGALDDMRRVAQMIGIDTEQPLWRLPDDHPWKEHYA